MKEIQQLEQIKWCYVHFLATYPEGKSVENTTYIQCNKEIIKASLKQLYGHLAYAITDDGSHTKLETPVKTHNNVNEAKAIMLFNADRKFSITE